MKPKQKKSKTSLFNLECQYNREGIWLKVNIETEQEYILKRFVQVLEEQFIDFELTTTEITTLNLEYEDEQII